MPSVSGDTAVDSGLLQSGIAPIYLLRLQRLFPEAERLFQEKLKRRPRAALARAYARLLVELERPEDAHPLWLDLAQAKPADFEACFQVAQWKVTKGASPLDAVAEIAPTASDLFKSRLIRVLTEPVIKRRPNLNVRHLAICGASYCGSTLLDRLLGSLSGVASVGESHWLTAARGTTGAEIDFGAAKPPSLLECTSCGSACPVLTLDFRMDLSANRKTWYQKIAERLQTAVLVSSDKNWAKIIDHDPLLRLDALVLFKSPLHAWRSKRAKLPTDKSGDFYEEQLRSYIRAWCRAYTVYFGAIRPTGAIEFVWFDEFAARPENSFEVLCERLGLRYEAGVLQRLRPGHTIGGNTGTTARITARNFKVEIQALPEPDLPNNEHEILEGDAEMQELFAAMCGLRVRM